MARAAPATDETADVGFAGVAADAWGCALTDAPGAVVKAGTAGEVLCDAT
jgi:hypothetical protein